MIRFELFRRAVFPVLALCLVLFSVGLHGTVAASKLQCDLISFFFCINRSDHTDL